MFLGSFFASGFLALQRTHQNLIKRDKKSFEPSTMGRSFKRYKYPERNQKLTRFAKG
jgi:hypothetical protein